MLLSKVFQPHTKKTLLTLFISIHFTIYLMNGVKVNGQVKGFDSYIIMLEDEKRQQNMIYKHAVSTIQPSRHINMQNNNQQNNGFNK